MSLNRVSPGTSVIDVLDHVLDKGIVIDPRVVVDFSTRFSRRANDRVRKERHDSRATTITNGKV